VIANIRWLKSYIPHKNGAKGQMMDSELITSIYIFQPRTGGYHNNRASWNTTRPI